MADKTNQNNDNGQQATKTNDNKKKVEDIMTDMQNVKADDPDMVAKLNEIALRVAEAQGKKPASSNSNNFNANNITSDPMDDLGCEGCQ